MMYSGTVFFKFGVILTLCHSGRVQSESAENVLPAVVNTLGGTVENLMNNGGVVNTVGDVVSNTTEIIETPVMRALCGLRTVSET